MDIVYGQQIRLTHTAPKSLQFSGLQGQYELVGKVLCRQIEPLGLRPDLTHFVADPLQDMCLAHTIAAMDKEGIKGALLFSNHNLGGVIGQFIGGAYHK